MRILYVEDNRNDADLARIELTRALPDVRMTFAHLLSEAWTELAEPDRFDVVVIDLNLPDGSGIDLVVGVRDKGLPVALVMLTGSGDERSAVAALKAGVDDYLIKRGDYLEQLPVVLESAVGSFRIGQARRSQPLRVLYAEHHKLDVELTRRHLARHAAHIRLDVAVAADDVLRRLGESPGSVDVLLLDYRLVGMNALELLRELRDGEGLRVPVVLVTGQGDEEVAVDALRLGAADYLVKRPGYLHELPSTLENAFSKAQLVREQAALRASEERFRQIAENLHEVFWMIDVDRHRMLYISPAYETIWGRPCSEILERPSDWLKAVYPEDQARVGAAIKRQIEGDYNEVYRVVRPDGEIRWIRDRAFPIRNEKGEVYRIVGTAEDVTENRRLEAQFLQAQKMEAIGTLAGGIAHDFNNILAAIMGYTELLRMQLGDHSEVAGYLQALQQASTRATALVRQILAFSRNAEQERRPVQMEKIVKEPLDLLRATVPVTVSFDVQLAEGLPPVLADATQIHQVVMNLGTNAAHAMKDGAGRLTVRLDSRDVTPGFARSTVRLRPGPHVVLTVSDTGGGIPREMLGRVFDPFFTTKAPGEGTGLGLAVVHGVMQAHEGEVFVSSTPGKGTTFELYFPAHEQPAESEEPCPGDVLSPGSGERILFVDDEAPIMLVCKAILERLGYRVEGTVDVLAALETLSAAPGDFDLVISDLTMPGMTGVDFARRVREIRADLPIILATGFNATLTAERVRELGVSELLLKPLSMQALASSVRRALESRERSSVVPSSSTIP